MFVLLQFYGIMYLRGEKRYMKMKKLDYVGFKFGDFFTDLLRQNGVMQRDISLQIGITEASLSRYANNITIETDP